MGFMYAALKIPSDTRWIGKANRRKRRGIPNNSRDIATLVLLTFSGAWNQPPANNSRPQVDAIPRRARGNERRYRLQDCDEIR